LAQVDSMDAALRNGLWTAVCESYWAKYEAEYASQAAYIRGSNLETLFKRYWHFYLKLPIDTIPRYFEEGFQDLRERFFECKWNEVYDFIEFTARNGPKDMGDVFIRMCNWVLERENSAYRFVGQGITEITSPEEIKAVESAIDKSPRKSGVKGHLIAALEHLSDRKNPDYRNSIKESISAVEALCQTVSGDKKATLGKALAILEERDVIHPALKSSFSSLYGYTSDADGIRHAMVDEPHLTSTDARFMLVACTSFINYIRGKMVELEIKI